MGNRLLLMLAAVLLVAGVAAAPSSASEDRGNAPPQLNFFAGGAQGARADWQFDETDSPDDDNMQDIEILTSTSPFGYAGFDVHHVNGTPTADYPPSSYELKSDVPGSTASAGSPRLVVEFSDGGNASLRPLFLTADWQEVADPNWDNNAGGCGFLFEVSWQDIQDCHAGTTIDEVYFIADPLGIDHWVDNFNTAGKEWNEAADNGAAPN